MIVKAYRAEWDGTLQPYALYVPRDYKPGRPGGWPLVVALHGAFSDHRHNLRRVFGLDNRPRENDAEASRNELPLPDVPALVVSPFGRGELMGYDGLGGDDVMRVIADVRRAYDVDPDRISLTGLSMGGGGTWQIGLRHPELFAALAPVCAVADYRRMVQAADAPLYDLDALDRQSPVALAGNAARMQVFIFHGAKDTTVPVGDSRKMVERFRELGWLRQERPLHRIPRRRAQRVDPGLQGRGAAAHARGDQARSGAPGAGAAPARVHGDSGPVRQERAPAGAAHLRVRHAWRAGRGRGRPRARERPGGLGADGRRALRGQGATPTSPPTIARGFRWCWSGRRRSTRSRSRWRRPTRRPLGDRAFRAIRAAGDRSQPGRCTLQLGALTPRGFDRLKRFARPNRDGWAPEPNRPFVLLAD